MAINSISPATQLEQPFNPVQNLAQLAAINGQNANTAKTQAETANEPIRGQALQSQAQIQQLQAQQAKSDMDDQQQIKNWMTDPSNADALKSGDLSGLAGKVQPRNYMGLQKTLVEGQEAAAKLSKAQLDLNNERHTQVGSFIDGLKLLPEADRPAAYQAGIASLNQQGLLKGINAPATITGSDEELNHLAGINNVYTGIYSKAQQRQKEQAEIDKTAAQTKEQSASAESKLAGIPEAKAKGQIAQAQADNMSLGGLLPEEQVKQQQAAAQQAQTAATLAETAAYHRGELGLRAAANDRENKVYEATYGSGSNPALQGVEPKMRSAAASQAQKAGTEYNQAQTAADEMKSIIDLARGGNKVAYAYAPTTGVLTINSANGVKRVNMAEIHSYAGAGSALDKVEGWLGKQISGESIPKDILDNMEQLHGQLSQNSYKTYQDKLQTTNNVYRSNFTPAAPPPAGGTATGGQKQSAGGYQAGHVYGGLTYHGGDPKDQANWTK